MPRVDLNHFLNHRDSLVEEQEQKGSLCSRCHGASPAYSCICHGCGFKLHKKCLDLSSHQMKQPFYHLFNHRDSLVFSEEQKQYGVNESVSYCRLCELPIFPGNPLYSCSSHGCEFKVHKWCRDLPGKITEHPFHPLTMFLFYGEWCWCDACCRDCGGVVYWCELCGFFLHIECAAALMKHPSHQHPLTPMSVTASFECSGCGTKHDYGLSNQCTVCPRFFVHQDCAVWPTTIERPDLHAHPLTLEYAFPKEYLRWFYSYRCSICGDQMKRIRWLYN